MAALTPILRAAAWLLFAERPAVGALILAAAFVRPWVGAFGLLAAGVSLLASHAAGFAKEAGERGLYAYNPLLVGLALGAFFEPSPALVALTLLAAVGTVLLQSALEATFGALLRLPVLGLPFVLVTGALLLAAPLVPALRPAAALASLWPEGVLQQYFTALGAIVFQPSLPGGLVIFAALLLHSRIAALLSGLGFLGGAMVLALVPGLSDGARLAIAYNSILTALALGGVYFVPQRATLLFAALFATLTGLGALGIAAFLHPLGLPLLALPFHLALWVALAAMRARVRDEAPRSVDFVSGTPEANLAFHRAREARFGANLAVRFALPVSGAWTVTQGHDGAHTHRDAWRHAFDLEVLGEDGLAFDGDGRSLRNFRAYRLPVLAVADGTVVRVVTDVPDNPIGERNPRDPWGNLVVIQHGPALFSLVCHLAPGSVEVAVGAWVRQGQRVAACGNSGRSFVPHVHLQLQPTARPGAPTLDVALNELVVRRGEQLALERNVRPVKGDVVRNLERRDELAALLAIPIGARRRWSVTRADGRVEQDELTAEIGLFNELSLASQHGGRLFFEPQRTQWLAFDRLGPRRGVLPLLWLALPRLPFELPDGLVWDDLLDARHVRPAWQSWLLEPLATLVTPTPLRLVFEATHEGADRLVKGRGSLGGRQVETVVRLTPGRGPVEIQVAIGDRRESARLQEALDAPADPVVAAVDPARRDGRADELGGAARGGDRAA